MRLLTPNEQRQVEQLKSFITKGYGHNDIGGWEPSLGDDRFFIDVEDSQELWLNLFEIILKKNDEMKDTWLKSSNPQI